MKMEKYDIHSIPGVLRETAYELSRAGFSTISSLKNITPEDLSNRMSPYCNDGFYSIERCEYLIQAANNIENNRKKTIREITEQFFGETNIDSWDEYEKKHALNFFSLYLTRFYNSGYANFDESNLFLINTDDNIASLTKRALFLPTVPTISFQNDHFGQVLYHHGNYEYLCHLPDENKSFEWFWSIKPFLQSGVLQYIPNIDVEKDNGKTNRLYENYTISTNECTISEKEKHYQTSGINSLEISIPYFDDIPFRLFCEIANEHTDAVKRFRTFFSKNINGINFNRINEVTDFEMALKEQVDNIGLAISRERQKLMRKYVADVAGTSAAVGATLLLFKNQNSIIDCIAQLGGIGVGIKKIVDDYKNFLDQKSLIKENECWFLWILKNNIA